LKRFYTLALFLTLVLSVVTLVRAFSDSALPLLTETAYAEDPQRLVFVFQKQKDPARMRAEAEEVATYLSKILGIPVVAQVPGDYAASVQALVSGTADIAYVDSIAFILARRDGGANILLAEERVDSEGKARTEYDSVFVVRKDSDLKSFADLKARASELSVAFTSPTSTSGYVMPYRRFVREDLMESGQNVREIFRRVSFAGSYAQALEQVVLGRADLCAVSHYTVEGAGAGQHISQENLDQLRILERTPGVPTHVIASRAGLSDELRSRIQDALLKLASENPHLLADVYGAARFTKVDEEQHVQASVEALAFLQLPADRIVKAREN